LAQDWFAGSVFSVPSPKPLTARAMLKIGIAFLFLASANGNILSPGLDKCLQVFQGIGGVTNVHVTTCTDNANQHFQILNGNIQNEALNGMCLTAESAAANADVHLVACSPQPAATQKWTTNHYGNIELGQSNLCLDIKAGLKADNTRENWNEIKQHNVNNVHLYTCHNPETTDRVNQLWTWAPFKNGQQVMASVAPVVVPTPVAASVLSAAVVPAVTVAELEAEPEPALAVPPVLVVPPAVAAPGATASMPMSVEAALAIQGVVRNYKVDDQALSTKSLGLPAWGVGCAAVTSSLVVLVGLYQWNSHTPAAVKDEEAEALGTEVNDF